MTGERGHGRGPRGWRGCLLGMLLAASTPLPAGEAGTLPVRVYDLQEEIGAAHIATDIYALADGRLHAATLGGPAVFDGVRWQVFNHPRGLGGYVHSAQGPDGRIHAGFNGDLGWWDPAPGAWQWHSLLQELPTDARTPGSARGVVLLDGGEVAFHLSVAQLVRLRRGASAEVLRPPTPLAGGWEVAGQLWLQDVDGRVAWLAADGPLAPQPVPGAQQAIGQDADGRGYFIRAVEHADGEWRLLLSDARVLRYRAGHFQEWPHAARERLRQQRPSGLTQLRDGRWVITSFSDATLVLGPEGDVLQQLGASEGVPARATVSAREDHQGGLWLAQARSLTRIDLAGAASFFGEAQGLPAGALQLLRWQGELYARDSNYLYRMRPGEGLEGARFERVAGEILRTVQGIAPAGDHLLVSSAGLHAWDPQGGARAAEKLRSGTGTTLAVSAVPGRWWWGQLSGIARLDEAHGGNHARTDIALGWSAWEIVEDGAHALWAADRSGSLARIDLAEPLSVRQYGSADGLPDGPVKLFPRRDGGIWLATREGVLVVEAGGERLRPAHELPAELRSARVFEWLEDDAGNLWVRAEGLNAVAWKQADGYRLDETVLRGLSVRPTINQFLREGDILWVARADGLLRIDLGRRRAPPPARAPFVSEARLIGNAAVLEPSALATLASDQRDLHLRFGAGDWHRPEALQFRSRLHGYDSGYSDWSALAERSYTNLPHGAFAFRLQVRDGYGRVSEAAPLAIAIAAPWFRSRAAYAGYALLALAMLWLAAQAGARRRQRAWHARQLALEREVATRTATIAEQNERLRAQADTLQQQAARLAEVDQLKTQFFINVGHEFRTPLTLVLGPLDDLLRDTALRLPGRVRELLELAQRNARRVLDLIVELLDVSRLEHGQLPLKRVRLDLADWLRRQLDEQQALIERHGHRSRLALPSQPLWVDVDPMQLSRVLANLVGNAAKYMPRGGLIEVELDADATHAWLRVSDHGRGIAATALAHVFDRFYRAEEGEAGGHGVGLALAREIVERHGGRIAVSSEIGLGSRFDVGLPLAAGEAPTVPAVVAETPAPAAIEAALAGAEADESPLPPGRELPRVLVVDDHAELRARLRQLLAPRFEVVEAEDGPGALQLTRTLLPDVVVADVMMPGFDGVELARRLRADPETAAIGILLLTAKAGADHAVTGLRAGADDYLAKPFDAAELLARIDALLAQMRRLQARYARAAQAAAAAPPMPVADRDERWRERLEQQIDAHLHEPAFNVEALAQTMHLDRSALFRRLKQMDALAPADLLRERRLLRARELLREGAGSVTEVAFAVGFENLSSFARAFRTRFACTPSSLLPGPGKAASG